MNVLVKGWSSVFGSLLLAWAAQSSFSADGIRYEEQGARPVATPYSSAQAGWDSYERAETQRRQTFDRQLWSNSLAQWYAGWPSPFFPPGLDAAYAYPAPATRAMRPAPLGAYRPYPGVFEPWPVLPGDIYGVPGQNRVEQSAGHEIVPDGNGGYVYRPVYPRELPSPVAETPAVETIEPNPPAQLPPSPEPIATPLPEIGPREF